MKKTVFLSAVAALVISSVSMAQEMCTAKGLSRLLNTDLENLSHRKHDADFARAMGGADVDIYSADNKIKVITTRFKSDAGIADMNFYLQNNNDYLMEYHIIQNSDFFGELDSVVLTDEKSYYHVCNNELLAPAIGGIIDDDIYQNLKLVFDVLMTEIGEK
ncbi:MAG: hypothetical protein P8J14_04975 [Emcibacteraceae bacterium]|nr:hypothetical protein [Emcibacteraceae bacterium]